jgi:glucosamine 6-phosphate synthetase-like amidotransferase/phosphosugar isomerase protein
MYIMKEPTDITRDLLLASVRYGVNNPDGFGIVTVSKDIKTDKGDLQLVKSNFEAAATWLKEPLNTAEIVTSVALFHARRKSSGGFNADDSHPYKSEDGKIFLSHNGCLYDEKKARDSLIQSGHVFKTDVDSEVLLHAYEEWGFDMFTKLTELGVAGTVAILILDNGRPIFFTNNGTLVLYKQPNRFIVISDSEIYGDTEDCFSLDDDAFYEIKSGKLYETKIKKPFEKYKKQEFFGYSAGNYVYSKKKGWHYSGANETGVYGGSGPNEFRSYFPNDSAGF